MEKVKEIFDKYRNPRAQATKCEAAIDYFINNLHDNGYSYQDLADRWQWTKGKAYAFINEMEDMPNYVTPVDKREKPSGKTTVVLQGKTDKLIELDYCPEKLDAKYFWIAKGFHVLFCKYHGTTKTLSKALASKWTDEVRKLVEIDKVKIEQLLAIKMNWELIVKGERGMDDFWINTITSMAAFRKKGKDGTYYWDRIVSKVKDWANEEHNRKQILQRVENYKEYVGIK